jgi:hypothetical protein
MAINIFTKIFKKIGKQWKTLVADFKSSALQDDQSQIYVKDF